MSHMYDPYHQCESWSQCCQNNKRLLMLNPLYQGMIWKHGKYGKRLKLTYSYYAWYMEWFFDELPHPDIMASTDCGVCFVCVPSKGRRKCIFRQEPGTYTQWYEKKRKQFDM